MTPDLKVIILITIFFFEKKIVIHLVVYMITFLLCSWDFNCLEQFFAKHFENTEALSTGIIHCHICKLNKLINITLNQYKSPS